MFISADKTLLFLNNQALTTTCRSTVCYAKHAIYWHITETYFVHRAQSSGYIFCYNIDSN